MILAFLLVQKYVGMLVFYPNKVFSRINKTINLAEKQKIYRVMIKKNYYLIIIFLSHFFII